jgi:ABC-type transporter Mla MlaB component
MAHTAVWETKGLWIKYSGVLTADEIIAAINEIAGDPRFDDISYRITDLTQVDRIDSSSTIEDVEKVAAFACALSKNNPNIKHAFVVNDESMQALAALYEMECEGNSKKIKQFTSIEEARDWTNIAIACD